MTSPDPLSLEAATGWTGPLRLVVTHRDSRRQREHVIDRPSAIIGHSSKCDIKLRKEDVAYRHAYLQVIGGQLLVVDCGTETGTVWDGRRKKADWLTPDRIVQIGDYAIQLLVDHRDASAEPVLPHDFNPLKTYRDQLGPLPRFECEFLNAQIKRLVVPLRHMLTLVGRHRSCKFHFDDESVSQVHAALLRTPVGLWVIDLLGRDGTIVNGKKTRCTPLASGDELKVGRYTMRVRADDATPESAIEDDSQSSARPGPASSILITSNRIFIVERVGNTLIVTPEGSPQQYRYADVHHEANRVLNLLEDPEISSLIVDLGREEVYTSIAISVFNRLRNAIGSRGGKVAICRASPYMQGIFRETGLYGLWQHFDTREDALRAFAG